MSKGALSRLANVIRAEMDDVLSKIEDPKKLVRQMVIDMDLEQKSVFQPIKYMQEVLLV